MFFILDDKEPNNQGFTDFAKNGFAYLFYEAVRYVSLLIEQG